MILYLVVALTVTMTMFVIGLVMINKLGNYETWYGGMAYLSLFASILLFLAIMFCIHWTVPFVVVGLVAALLRYRYLKFSKELGLDKK